MVKITITEEFAGLQAKEASVGDMCCTLAQGFEEIVQNLIDQNKLPVEAALEIINVIKEHIAEDNGFEEKKIYIKKKD